MDQTSGLQKSTLQDNTNEIKIMDNNNNNELNKDDSINKKNDKQITIKDESNMASAATASIATRDSLPSAMVPWDDLGIWSIVKSCIGRDLSSITIPVIFNEPTSFLQRMSEIFQYSHYLNIADQCDDIIERMENISTFIVSAYSSNFGRLNKPFNPLLGETYELEISSSKTRVVCEQVSHHPPVCAMNAESDNFIFNGYTAPKLRFWGKSIEVKPDGLANLKLKTKGDIITYRPLNWSVHNIIIGKIWFEQYGTMEIINHSNGWKVLLTFKQAGWFGYDFNRVEGFIINDKGIKKRFIYGKWNDYLKSAPIEDYDEYLRLNNNRFRAPDLPAADFELGSKKESNSNSNNVITKLNNLPKQLSGNNSNDNDNDNNIESKLNDNLNNEKFNSDIPKSDSSHSLDIPNSRILWKSIPKPLNSEKYYNFTSFTFGLNELPQDKNKLKQLAPTDSRFRMDIRKLEEGDLDGAASEKKRLEEKQREARRLRKKGKMKAHKPSWFQSATNQYTDTKEWQFTNEYFNRDWSRCPDIF